MFLFNPCSITSVITLPQNIQHQPSNEKMSDNLKLDLLWTIFPEISYNFCSSHFNQVSIYMSAFLKDLPNVSDL